jgi:hypothetical protein
VNRIVTQLPKSLRKERREALVDKKPQSTGPVLPRRRNRMSPGETQSGFERLAGNIRILSGDVIQAVPSANPRINGMDGDAGPSDHREPPHHAVNACDPIVGAHDHSA